MGDEDGKVERTNSSEPHAKKKKTEHVATKLDKSNDSSVKTISLAADMYDRVCVKARKAVKDAVGVVRKGDRSEEARKEITKARDFVEKLKSRKEKNEHIDGIMCLSNDGDDLVGEATNISSQTMKEDLEVFHGF